MSTVIGKRKGMVFIFLSKRALILFFNPFFSLALLYWLELRAINGVDDPNILVHTSTTGGGKYLHHENGVQQNLRCPYHTEAFLLQVF